MNSQKRRSRFRIFLKWLLGLLAIPVIAVALLSFNFYDMTKPEQFQKKLNRYVKTATVKVKKLQKKDISKYNLSKETTDKLLKNKKILSAKDIAAYKKSIENIIKNHHKDLKFAALVTGGAAAFILLLIFLVSYRFGKLVSIGVVIILGSLPVLTISLLFNKIGNSLFSMINFKGINTLPALMNKVPKEAIDYHLRIMTFNTLYVIAGAIGLFIIAFVGKFIYNIATGTSENDNRYV